MLFLFLSFRVGFVAIFLTYFDTLFLFVSCHSLLPSSPLVSCTHVSLWVLFTDFVFFFLSLGYYGRSCYRVICCIIRMGRVVRLSFRSNDICSSSSAVAYRYRIYWTHESQRAMRSTVTSKSGNSAEPTERPLRSTRVLGLSEIEYKLSSARRVKRLEWLYSIFLVYRRLSSFSCACAFGRFAGSILLWPPL